MLTVTGENLNSAAYPKLHAEVSIVRPPSTTSDNYITGSEVCSLYTVTIRNSLNNN